MGDSDVKAPNALYMYQYSLNRGDYDADSYIEGMSANIDLMEKYFDK